MHNIRRVRSFAFLQECDRKEDSFISLGLLTMAGRLMVLLLCAHGVIATDDVLVGSSDLYGGQHGGTSKVTLETEAAEQDRGERILNKGEPTSLSDYKLDCTASQWYVGADGQLKECEGSENTEETINGQGIIHEQELRPPLHVYLSRLPTAGLPIWSSVAMNNLWAGQFHYPSDGQIYGESDEKKPIEPHGEIQEHHKPTLELKPVIAKPIVVHKPVVVWKPIVIKPVHKPIVIPVHKPIVIKPIHKPIVIKPIEIPVHKPIVIKPIHKPIVIKPVHKPIEIPVLKPIHKPIVIKPIEIPVHKPIVIKPVHKPIEIPVHKPIVIKPVHKPIELPLHEHGVSHSHIPPEPHKVPKPHEGHHKPGHDAVVGGSQYGDFHSTGHVLTLEYNGKDIIPQDAQQLFNRPIFFPIFQTQSVEPPLLARLFGRQTVIPGDEKILGTRPATLGDEKEGTEDDQTEDEKTRQPSEVNITPKPGGERANDTPRTRRRTINFLIPPLIPGPTLGMPGMMIRSMLPNIVQGIRFRHTATPHLGLDYRSKLPVEQALDRVKHVINESIKPTTFPGVQQFLANQKLREYISGNTTTVQSIRLGHIDEETTERQVATAAQTILDNGPREPIDDTLDRVKNIISASSEQSDGSEAVGVQGRIDLPQEGSTQEQEQVKEDAQPIVEVEHRNTEVVESEPVTQFMGQNQTSQPEESQAKINDQEQDAFVTTLPRNSQGTSEDAEVTTDPTYGHLEGGPDLLEGTDEDQEIHMRKNREAPGVPIDILNDERETILGRTTLLEIMSALKEQYMKNAEPDQRKLIEDAFDRLHCSVRNMKELDERPAKKVDGPKKATLELLAETTQPLMDEPDYYSDAADDASAEPSFLELLNVATKHKGKSHDSDVNDA